MEESVLDSEQMPEFWHGTTAHSSKSSCIRRIPMCISVECSSAAFAKRLCSCCVTSVSEKIGWSVGWLWISSGDAPSALNVPILNFSSNNLDKKYALLQVWIVWCCVDAPMFAFECERVHPSLMIAYSCTAIKWRLLPRAHRVTPCCITGRAYYLQLLYIVAAGGTIISPLVHVARYRNSACMAC